jgi:hypothetical protein
VAQIDHADIDGHLLRLARALPVFDCRETPLHAICLGSNWNPIGTQSQLSGLRQAEDHFSKVARDHTHPADDLLDDLGELAETMGGEVIVMPAERLSVATGLDVTFRC